MGALICTWSSFVGALPLIVVDDLQEQIDRACETNPTASSPAVVLLPEGQEVSNSDPIDLVCSNLVLQIDGLLKFSDDPSRFPLVDPLPSYGIGRDVPTNYTYKPCIFGSAISNVEIRGKGVVDGSGEMWWAKHFAKRLNVSRPPLVEIAFSDDIRIGGGLTFKDSPFWTLHPYASTNIQIDSVFVRNPSVSPNTDGVDVDSCTNVTITNCHFSVGDDGISIKSGLNEAGRKFGMPSQNIYVANITVDPTFDNLSTNGISIGSEMSGGVRNVTIENIIIRSCESGIYVKSMEGRGGVVEDVHVQNITMSKVLQGLRLSMNYMYRRNLRVGGSEESWKRDDEGTPQFSNITFKDVRGTALEAGFFVGLKQSFLRDVR